MRVLSAPRICTIRGTPLKPDQRGPLVTTSTSQLSMYHRSRAQSLQDVLVEAYNIVTGDPLHTLLSRQVQQIVDEGVDSCSDV